MSEIQHEPAEFQFSLDEVMEELVVSGDSGHDLEDDWGDFLAAYDESEASDGEADDDADDAADPPDLDEIVVAWQEFVARLDAVLGVLENGHALVLGAPHDRFVQLAVQGDEARIESVSNQFLDPEYRLSSDDLDALANFGWEPPTHFPDEDEFHSEGSPNHFIELSSDWRHQGTAVFLAATLRLIHDVDGPTKLTYKAFSEAGEVILLPSLGLSRRVARP